MIIGWDKDGDHNVVDGATVGPLPTNRGKTNDGGSTPPLPPPVRGGEGGVGPSGTSPRQLPEDRTDWRLRYNTRFVPRDRFSPRD